MPDNFKSNKIKKIVVNKNLCIGCASCMAIAPEVFELDENNKAGIKNITGADDETIILAAHSCAVNAISLYDENGKQIWPET